MSTAQCAQPGMPELRVISQPSADCPQRETYAELVARSHEVPDCCYGSQTDLEFERFTRILDGRSPYTDRLPEFQKAFGMIMGSCSWLAPALADILDAVLEAQRLNNGVRPEAVMGIIATYAMWRERTEVLFTASI